ncbi:hypothetical protein A6R68_17718, partial [Neotoma lepida]
MPSSVQAFLVTPETTASDYKSPQVSVATVSNSYNTPQVTPATVPSRFNPPPWSPATSVLNSCQWQQCPAIYIGHNGFLEIYRAFSVFEVNGTNMMNIPLSLRQIGNATPKINTICTQRGGTFVNGVFAAHV